VTKVYDVYTGNELEFDGDSAGTISGIDRKASLADSIVAVVYGDEVRHVWANYCPNLPLVLEEFRKSAINPKKR
jgi:hypothetical protein